MNSFGYDSVAIALRGNSIEHAIYPPCPDDDKSREYNEQYIEINTDPSTHHQSVVAALGRAGFMENGPTDHGLAVPPQFKISGIMPGRLLLEDLNFRES